MSDQPADGRIHEQKNPDGSKSNYDDTGDKVKKNTGGQWIKDKSPDSVSSSSSTTSTTSSKITTGH